MTLFIFGKHQIILLWLEATSWTFSVRKFLSLGNNLSKEGLCYIILWKGSISPFTSSSWWISKWNSFIATFTRKISIRFFWATISSFCKYFYGITPWNWNWFQENYSMIHFFQVVLILFYLKYKMKFWENNKEYLLQEGDFSGLARLGEW